MLRRHFPQRQLNSTISLPEDVVPHASRYASSMPRKWGSRAIVDMLSQLDKVATPTPLLQLEHAVPKLIHLPNHYITPPFIQFLIRLTFILNVSKPLPCAAGPMCPSAGCPPPQRPSLLGRLAGRGAGGGAAGGGAAALRAGPPGAGGPGRAAPGAGGESQRGAGNGSVWGEMGGASFKEFIPFYTFLFVGIGFEGKPASQSPF